LRSHDSNSRRYADLYVSTRKDVHAEITRKLKELDSVKPAPTAAVKKAVEDALRDNYELGIKEVGAPHEEIMGHRDTGAKGNIEETLDALPVQPSRSVPTAVQRTSI